VKRIKGALLGVPDDILPKGSLFEITLMNEETLKLIKGEMHIDTELLDKAVAAPGDIIIKAAGNMAYPMGLRTEKISVEIETASRMKGKAFEFIAGLGADSRTMIGAGAQKSVPVIVSVPQLIGGGMAGLAVGDSISLKHRFETYTGHGIWSAWEGMTTYSLKEKTLVRIDLDPNLEKVWQMEKSGGDVQVSVDRGLPKTKTLKVPFRMEMSGFARLESSIPVVGDLGVLWPVIAHNVSGALGIELDFISYPQETEQGKEMREWIVEKVNVLNMKEMRKQIRKIDR
jgi:hypothetical protein